MLSVECQAVYNALFELAGDSEGYKIIDAEEVTEKIPPDMTLTKVQLSQVIRDLKDLEYVDIKYFTPDEYCLRVYKRVIEEPQVQQQAAPMTEEGAVQVQQQSEQPQQKKERKLYGEKKRAAGGVKRGMVFFMSFLGGLLGSGVVATITAVLMKFVL